MTSVTYKMSILLDSKLNTVLEHAQQCFQLLKYDRLNMEGRRIKEDLKVTYLCLTMECIEKSLGLQNPVCF